MRTFRSVVAGVMIALVTAFSFTIQAEEPKDKKDEKPAKLVTSIPTETVPQYLQDISVTIRASGGGRFGGAEGSGVFKTTKDNQVWVWTCGHLVEHLRTTRKTDDGKTIVEFHDAQVIKVITENGRKVGELKFDAEVIRYSDADHGEDLALLRLRSKKYQPSASVVFYLDKEIPAIGTRLFHCGSLLGQLGSNSMTNGIVSQHGRVFGGVIYDQTNCATFPGSSGGIICLEKDGRYVGMLVRGAGETFSLYVPVRRMQAWAKKVGVEFAMDDNLPVPSDEELKKTATDDSMKNPASTDKMPAAHSKLFPTMERRINADGTPLVAPSGLLNLFGGQK